MNVEIIAIGDELLIGQTINTNASWLGQECTKLGANIVRSSVIADEPAHIIEALQTVYPTTDLILITGGLGPTQDDLTKHTLAAYFNMSLAIDPETLKHIEAFFEARKRPMLEVNIQQAALPVGARILKNRIGTAAGMWFEQDHQVFLSLPGVPYEMKTIMLEEAFPALQARFQMNALFQLTGLTQGIGESFLADRFADWENRIRSAGFGLAYLPSPGAVKLRITSKKGPEDRAQIESYFNELKAAIPEAFYGYGTERLEEIVGKQLLEKHASIGTVESCTAGLLASAIARVPGASAYYQGALLTYSNELKQKVAKIDGNLLQKHGAVSEEVALQMAENGRELLGVDYCLATTGVAGPSGGSPDKPVGLVWIGLAGPNGSFAKRFYFGDDRGRNLDMTVLSALNCLRYHLLTSA